MLCTGEGSMTSGRDLGLGDDKGGRTGQAGAPDLRLCQKARRGHLEKNAVQTMRTSKVNFSA